MQAAGRPSHGKELRHAADDDADLGDRLPSNLHREYRGANRERPIRGAHRRVEDGAHECERVDAPTRRAE